MGWAKMRVAAALAPTARRLDASLAVEERPVELGAVGLAQHLADLLGERVAGVVERLVGQRVQRRELRHRHHVGVGVQLGLGDRLALTDPAPGVGLGLGKGDRRACGREA
jgi:hypothetical protein